jgi:HipA-like C-terminal domain
MTVISVGTWARDEDNPVFPVGANPKRLLLCPGRPPSAELIAGHRYLFKTAKGWKAGQLWSEYLAFELAVPTGVHVPRCFVAVDEITGESGVLVEFFYGYPGDVPGLRFIHGSDITQAVITDKKKGRPHSIQFNVRLCRRLGVNDPEIWWGQVLAFDALVGDTDRHPDNWGLLVRLGREAAPQHAMAPAFDNGTSLAYEIPDDRLPGPKDQKWFDRYAARGTHHAGWSLRKNEATPHFEMCSKFLAEYPAAGAAMRNVILCDESHTGKVLASCTAMVVPNGLSEKRAEFLGKLLATRRRELERVLS